MLLLFYLYGCLSFQVSSTLCIGVGVVQNGHLYLRYWSSTLCIGPLSFSINSRGASTRWEVHCVTCLTSLRLGQGYCIHEWAYIICLTMVQYLSLQPYNTIHHQPWEEADVQRRKWTYSRGAAVNRHIVTICYVVKLYFITFCAWSTGKWMKPWGILFCKGVSWHVGMELEKDMETRKD